MNWSKEAAASPGQVRKGRQCLSRQWIEADTDVSKSSIFRYFQPKVTKAIEHREGNWSRRRLLLDVGATDAHDKAAQHRSGGLVWTFLLRGSHER